MVRGGIVEGGGCEEGGGLQVARETHELQRGGGNHIPVERLDVRK